MAARKIRTRASQPSLVRSLTQNLKHATWLTESDQPAVDLAYTYAHQLDDVFATGTDEQIRKHVGWIGPHFLRTCTELGLTPTARRALRQVQEDNARLSELRAGRPQLHAVE